MKKVKIKKRFLLIEVLIAITLLTLCLLPFIPKSNSIFLNFKKNAAFICLEEHFEEKVCQIRQRAYVEGLNWIKNQKMGKVLSFSEPFWIEDLSLKGNVTCILFLERIVESKNPGKNIYRLKFTADYAIAQIKKHEKFWFYLTLEI